MPSEFAEWYRWKSSLHIIRIRCVECQTLESVQARYASVSLAHDCQANQQSHLDSSPFLYAMLARSG
jgi:hypothetical protein